MITHSRKWLWMALLLSWIAADGARGQWRIVAPNIFAGTHWYSYGAMCFHDGIVRLAVDAMFTSSDSGITWTTKNLPSIVTQDIQFYSPTEGVISCGGIWFTHDAGTTWQEVMPPVGATSVCYLNDPNGIAVAEDTGPLGVTVDGGKTWRDVPPQKDQFCVQYKAGTVYEFGGDASGGFIFTSSDFGLTWKQCKTGIDWDSYSFSIDSCDANRIYLSHEDAVAQTDQFSKIIISTDRGDTWQTMISQPQPFFCGSVAEGNSALYCQSVAQGVFRSTDKGMTWSSIGGPSVGYDTRMIAAINDNILIAVDNDGNVWRTDNSGGDSVISTNLTPMFSASPVKLFSSDTITCDSVTRSVSFSRSGCNPPTVSSWSIIGADSLAFNASNLSVNSISVTLNGSKLGDQNAELVLSLDNGGTDTIVLAGYVSVFHSGLKLSTEDLKTDTLGGNVAVPITINGLVRPEDVDLVLHYDGTVDYLGSFSPLGVRLDISGDSSLGRSKLHIPGAAPGVAAGYAKFNVFNDSNRDAHATFDSVSVLTAISPCEYSLPEAVTSTITPPSGCGATILSQLIHLGIEPSFSVRPNPANGDVWISSTADLGDVTIAVYDMLGVERSEIVASVSKDNPVELLLPQADGVYNIVAKYSNGTSTMRVVREHY